ncbi:MAG: hypothetical protein KGH61_01975 [Candidatus Micrarchaeota archaeon]|nr:hypothetical protein [Candidatus Micrarchaeota archaeon]MDE1847698.1 hypothetical protein [Candidatus Micrarchaeota archaeon]MDE1864127.1 hypothetical protein [Candidatus Micrarchaeota archaeon]
MEDLLCRAATRLILPAVRISIAQSLSKEHKYTQEQISGKLGIVQVAVSKYINGKYSREVGEVKEYIENEGLGKRILDGIVGGASLKETERRIDALCNDPELIQFAIGEGMAINTHRGK